LTLLGKKLAVAIPDTVLEEKDSLREKTAKLGLVARACAIYGVDIVEIFRDKGGRGEQALIKKVLEFLETPQYLRKKLYPMDEALRFAGVLPPLRIPSHRPREALDALKLGQVREGVVNGDGTVDLGLEVPAKLPRGEQPGRRVTVKITKAAPLTAELVSRDDVDEYWGYRMETKTVDEVFSDTRFGLKIATSRLGTPLQEQLSVLRGAVRSAAAVKLVFGAPSRGLFDIVGDELDRKADFVLNLFPEQQVQTVRTEEAIFAGLNLVSIVSTEKA
jgi:predicted SPOUT superfamily RNA methylase MTH1